jgi:hypothetical protein
LAEKKKAKEARLAKEKEELIAKFEAEKGSVDGIPLCGACVYKNIKMRSFEREMKEIERKKKEEQQQEDKKRTDDEENGIMK